MLYEVRYAYGNQLVGYMNSEALNQLIAKEARENCPSHPIFREWSSEGWTYYDTSISVYKARQIEEKDANEII